MAKKVSSQITPKPVFAAGYAADGSPVYDEAGMSALEHGGIAMPSRASLASPVMDDASLDRKGGVSSGVSASVDGAGNVIARDVVRGVADSSGDASSSSSGGGYERFGVRSYGELEDWLLRNLRERRPETDDERRARERRERTRGIIGGIADVGRALSNLYFTHRGAPNAYDGRLSMSERSRQLAERMGASKERERDAWLNYALQLGKLRSGERSWGFQLARQAEADALAREREKERRRANEALEAERERANKEKEAERERANKAKEADARQRTANQASHYRRSEGISAARAGEQARHNRVSEAQGWSRIGGGGKTVDIYADDGSFVSVPTSRWNVVNIRQVFNQTPNRPGKPRGRVSKAEMERYIGECMNDDGTVKALKYIARGGADRSGTVNAKDAPQPGTKRRTGTKPTTRTGTGTKPTTRTGKYQHTKNLGL